MQSLLLSVSDCVPAANASFPPYLLSSPTALPVWQWCCSLNIRPHSRHETAAGAGELRRQILKMCFWELGRAVIVSPSKKCSGNKVEQTCVLYAVLRVEVKKQNPRVLCGRHG